MDGESGFAMGGLKDNPGVARLIGEFIARWSLAEAALMMPLLAATGTNDREPDDQQEVAAAMLSATNSTEGKIKLVKSAVENMTARPDLKAPIKRALSKLMALCEERNALCHHAWAYDYATKGAATIDFRKAVGDPARITPRSEDSLRSLCNRTVEAARDICAASGSHWVTDEAVERSRI